MWGLVLGGAGAVGLLNAAIIRWVQETKLPVSCCAATGSGSAIAALYAQGFHADAITSWIHDVLVLYRSPKRDWYTFCSFFLHWRGKFNCRHAVFDAKPLLAAYKRLWGDIRIEDLPMPLYLATTDVLHGKSVILTRGHLARSVYAANALLPFFPPLEQEGVLLADGSFTDPFPVMPLIDKGLPCILVPYFEEGWAPFGEQRMPVMTQYARFLNQAIYIAQRHRMALALDLHPGEMVFVKLVLPEPLVLQPRIVNRILDSVYQQWAQAMEAYDLPA